MFRGVSRPIVQLMHAGDLPWLSRDLVLTVDDSSPFRSIQRWHTDRL